MNNNLYLWDQHFCILTLSVTMRGVSLLLVTAQALLAQDAPTPVVLWHGMGDSAAGMVGIAVSNVT